MGCMFLGAGLASLIIALLLGALAVRFHVRVRRKGRGSWVVFGLVTALVCAALMWLGQARFPTTSGAPTGEDYEAILFAFALIGAAPGVALCAGGLIASLMPEGFK